MWLTLLTLDIVPPLGKENRSPRAKGGPQVQSNCGSPLAEKPPQAKDTLPASLTILVGIVARTAAIV